MKELRGDLWEFHSAASNNIACVTTNGIVTKSGTLVMGRGVALSAKLRFPGIDLQLGELVRRKGNTVFFLKQQRILTFPTKHSWKLPSDTKLIVRSAACLAEIAGRNTDLTFYLPRPGCANGWLLWKDVKPLIENILPDNVVVITL